MLIKNGMRNLSSTYIELDVFPEKNKGFDSLIKAINPDACVLRAQDLKNSYQEEVNVLQTRVNSFKYIQSMHSEIQKIERKINDINIKVRFYEKYEDAMTKIKNNELFGVEMLNVLFDLGVIRE